MTSPAAILALHRAGLRSDAKVVFVSVADVSPPVPRDSDAEVVGGYRGGTTYIHCIPTALKNAIDFP